MRASLEQKAVDAAKTSVLLSPSALRAVGISPDAAEQAVADGKWQRPVRGRYIPHPRELTPVELAQAGCAWLGRPCVISGLVVLHLQRLRWLPAATEVHLLVDDAVRRASNGPFVVQRTPEWQRDAFEGLGLLWAPVERAVVDAAMRSSSLREARGIVLAAVADHRATTDQLLTVLGTCRRNGSGFARRAIGDAIRGCASPPEAELVDALIPLGVPFLVNPEIWLEGVKLGSTDVWVLGTAVGGEVESAERHEGDRQTESTYDRHERFRGGGLDLVHLSVRRIRSDATEAAQFYLQRAAEGQPAPPGLVVVPKGPVLGSRGP
jgi:hypothetical protein